MLYIDIYIYIYMCVCAFVCECKCDCDVHEILDTHSYILYITICHNTSVDIWLNIYIVYHDIPKNICHTTRIHHIEHVI